MINEALSRWATRRVVQSLANHRGADCAMNGDLRAAALNDAAALTCMGSDVAFEMVFARHLNLLAHEDDVRLGISEVIASRLLRADLEAERSSGTSPRRKF
jgi:phosphoheptose isomerase